MVSECETVRHAVIATIRMQIPKVCINNDSQIVVYAVNGKLDVSKDIINLVEDIRWLCYYFRKFIWNIAIEMLVRKLMI